METTYTDIEDLGRKRNNEEAEQEIESDGINEQEYLTAEQWNRTVNAVKELQESDPKSAVKSVTFNGSKYTPDKDGNVSFNQTTASTVYSMGLTLAAIDYLQATTEVSIPVKVSYQQKPPIGDVQDRNETVVLHIYTRTNSALNFVEKGTATVMSNLPEFTDIDVSPYLQSGYNEVQIKAVSSNPVNVNSQSVYIESSEQSVMMNVVALSLVPNIGFQTPFSSTASSIILNYALTGAISKYLRIMIYADRDFTQLEYNYANSGAGIALGENESYPGGHDFSFDTTSAGTIGNVLSKRGHHYIRAMLYASDSIKTNWVDSEIMTSPEGTVVVVNNIREGLANWSDVTFFNWAASAVTPVRFRLTNSANPDSETSTEYAQWNFSAQPNVQYTFTSQLGVILENSSVTSFEAYMHIDDGEGNKLSDSVLFVISNSAEFAPISGAEFILRPALRSNSESNPQSIINAANGGEIESVWEGFDMVNDGYIDVPVDLDNSSLGFVRALHIPAGRKLTISYNALRNFINPSNTAGALANKNMTLEIDFRTSNILDENEPIINLSGRGSWGDIYGFEVLPTEAALLTYFQHNRDDQNVMWAEGKRTRLSVNILYGYSPENDATKKKKNIANLFINDKKECSFFFEENDSFLAEDTSLVIGAENSDIDIFSIYCHQKALSTSDVMQDYKAGLPTTAEKLAFAAANDILVNGVINMDKCISAGYNVVAHTGHLPNKLSDGANGDKGKTTGTSLYVHFDGEPSNSGTYTDLEIAGQGTTAMTYMFWNPQWKVTESSTFTSELGETSSKAKFIVASGEPKAKKACGKINWASSQQGHKMGLTKLYTDLYKWLLANNTHVYGDAPMSTPYQLRLQPNARLAVYQRPVLFFQRESETDEYKFISLMTWGAGKGDKPTFGFTDDTPNMMMIEGADNDAQLALFSAPWNADVSYDSGKEAWYYANTKNLNFGLGKTDANDKPSSEEALAAHRNMRNFVYLHSPNIRHYAGTLSQLRNDEPYAYDGEGNYITPDKDMMYWTTTPDSVLGSAQYDLFRYDLSTSSWVVASIDKTRSNVMEFNIRTQYENFCASLGDAAENWSGLSGAAVSQIVVSTRVRHFRATATSHIHVNDALYNSCFVKFIGGTDNRGKNDYQYTDPEDLKIRHLQDDLDTTYRTNNVGQNRKPYYVEELDKDENGKYYWQAAHNAYFRLLELAFEPEMTIMMRAMLTGMAALGGGSMSAFINNYLLEAQNYFPAVAYNENARLMYEIASLYYNEPYNGYTYENGTHPISQSKGSQQWSEFQWITDRIMYISSWCEYGEFSASESSAGTLSWRGTSGTYSFTLTPAKWLYPRIGRGGSIMDAVSSEEHRHRVRAGETFSYLPFTNNSDSYIGIKGINYFLKIGDMNIPISTDQTTFTFSGKKLQEITINPTGASANKFKASAISVGNATNIKRFVARNLDSVNNPINLSQCSRLKEIDVRGGAMPSIQLPETNALTTAHLSAISSIALANMPNLSVFDIEGYSNLRSVRLDETSVGVSIKGFINALRLNNVSLSSAILHNVHWTDTDAAMLDYLASAAISDITGTIAISPSTIISYDQKMKYVEKWGDIDDSSNPLVITYTSQALTSFQIGGKNYLTSIGNHQYDIVTSSEGTGNDVVSITWSYAATETEGVPDYNISDYINGITQKGVVNVKNLSEDKDFIVSCTMVKKDGTSIVRTYTVGLYAHPRTIGDYVFSDGSWSDRLNPSKTVIGKCFMLIDEEHGLCRQPGSFRAQLFWGLNDSTTAGVPGIELQDADSDMSAYDTPLVNSNTPKQESLVTLEEDIFDTGIGSVVTRSMYNNLIVLKHRNRIMNDSGVGLTEYIPEIYHAKQSSYGRNISMLKAYEECETALYNLAVSQGKSGNAAQAYRSFLFPMFTYCHSYEPSVKDGEVLAQHLRAGKWFLPLANVYKTMYDNREEWMDSNYIMTTMRLYSCEEIVKGYAISMGGGRINSSANSATGIGTAWSNMPAAGSDGAIAVAVCIF
ncbi:MAG: hypothetical protein IJK45_01415 [Bacteroidaceae bacterium]|nr:hypothetical protein [Bacteroidaceae bacterium]